jgi:hypothetical protein
MKQERTIKELLQLMLDNKDLFETGLCRWDVELSHKNLINFNENVLLRDFIKNNKPSDYKENSPYYWEVFDIEPRIKWLEEHISKL